MVKAELYILQPVSLAELREWLAYFDRFWDNRLSVLKNLIENDGSTYPEHNEKEE